MNPLAATSGLFGGGGGLSLATTTEATSSVSGGAVLNTGPWSTGTDKSLILLAIVGAVGLVFLLRRK